MTCLGVRIAAAARTCLGAPFRLHGRDPATGLDCVGLVLWCCRQGGLELPDPPHYRLRNARLAPLLTHIDSALFGEPRDKERPGDVWCIGGGPGQLHLLIADGPGRFVHAHAGLRQVVRSPLPAGRVIVRRRAITDLKEG
jgi:cell wall-associated NlpC family hydrolase